MNKGILSIKESNIEKEQNLEENLISVKTLHLYLFSVVMLGGLFILYPAINSPFAQKHLLFSILGTPIIFLLALLIPGLTYTALLPGQRNIITFIGVNLFFSALTIIVAFFYFLYFSIDITMINYIVILLILTFIPVLLPGKNQLQIKGPFYPRHLRSWALACFFMLIFDYHYYDPWFKGYEYQVDHSFIWNRYEMLKFPKETKNFQAGILSVLNNRKHFIDAEKGDSIELFNHQNMKVPVEIRWVVTNKNSKDGKISVFQGDNMVYSEDIIGLFDILRDDRITKPSANNLVSFNALLEPGKNVFRIEPYIDDEKSPKPIEIVDFTGLNRHDFTLLFDKNFLICILPDVRVFANFCEFPRYQSLSELSIYEIINSPTNIFWAIATISYFLFFISCKSLSGLDPIQVYTILHVLFTVIIAWIMAGLFENIKSGRMVFFILLSFLCVFTPLFRNNAEVCVPSTLFAMNLLFFAYSLYSQDIYASHALFAFVSISEITGFVLAILIVAIYYLLCKTGNYHKKISLYGISFLAIFASIILAMALLSDMNTISSLVAAPFPNISNRASLIISIFKGQFSWELLALQWQKIIRFSFNLMIVTSWLPLFIFPLADKKILSLIGAPTIYFFLLAFGLSNLCLHYLCSVLVFFWAGAPFAIDKLTGKKRKIALISLLILSASSVAFIHARYWDIFALDYVSSFL